MSLFFGGSLLLLGAPMVSDNLKAAADPKNVDTNGTLVTAENFEDPPIRI
ncbi:MAG: hypothetical protein ACOC35_13115 [Promethearchaeia archaeon]